jgi:predicted metallopeptidase
MSEAVVKIEKVEGAIKALSERLKVPALRVIEVYRSEFKRLAAQSRIETYLDVLALRNTKSILAAKGRETRSLEPR